jgi:hypothetical protein
VLRVQAYIYEASDDHAAAREFASGARGHEPKFTDKEINLEIYAERQNDSADKGFSNLRVAKVAKSPKWSL